MRRLTKTAFLALALCAAAVLPASAAPPTVGGPKGASLAFGFTATGPQQHLLAETAGSTVPGNPDSEVTDTCVAPRCYAFAFALFGISDFVQAYHLTSWLLVWKLLNLIALLVLRKLTITRHYPQSKLF